MASIRKRGNSYLIIVSRGYDYQGNRIKPAQKTVHPPQGLTEKQITKWLNEQAVLYEMEVKHTAPVDRSITLAKYIEIWLEQVAPKKLALSTLTRDKQDIRRILPKLILATGMRRGEACGLRWSDIDWRDRSLHIQRNVVKVSYQPILVKDPKTRAGNRVVYLSEELCKLLRAWQKESVWEKEQLGGGALAADDYLFRQPNGDPMVPGSFTFRFKKILRENSLPEDLNVHSLRHTNASLLIAQGVDVRTVAGLLGHAQPSTTLDIYSHAFDKNKKLAQQKLGEVIRL